MPLEFIVNGQPVGADELVRRAPPAKKNAPNSAAEFHKGFFVEGFPAGHVEAAEQAHKAAYQSWHAMGANERAEAIKRGARDPGPWDEAKWLRKNKPKRLSKLYGTPVAADEFAALAIRQGFTHVQAKAQAKEKS